MAADQTHIDAAHNALKKVRDADTLEEAQKWANTADAELEGLKEPDDPLPDHKLSVHKHNNIVTITLSDPDTDIPGLLDDPGKNADRTLTLTGDQAHTLRLMLTDHKYECKHCGDDFDDPINRGRHEHREHEQPET